MILPCTLRSVWIIGTTRSTRTRITGVGITAAAALIHPAEKSRVTTIPDTIVARWWLSR
ncbi:GSCOCG00006783001-RA-CDS [Cotesia congregata]|nr:GSCOCG00006783001-RA-CDS [Cotesia congregata]